jgi:hypothetical protein
MIREQVISSSFSKEPHDKRVSCDVRVRIETPGEAEVSVGIILDYRLPLTDLQLDNVNQLVRNAVHGGIAIAARAIPAGGMRVLISDVTIGLPLSVDEIEDVLPKVVEHAIASLLSIDLNWQ